MRNYEGWVYSTNPIAVRSREYKKKHPEQKYRYKRKLSEEQLVKQREYAREYMRKIHADPVAYEEYKKKRRDIYMRKRYGIIRTNGTTDNQHQGIF